MALPQEFTDYWKYVPENECELWCSIRHTPAEKCEMGDQYSCMFGLIQETLDICLGIHPQCKKQLFDTTAVPTRLIDVGSIDPLVPPHLVKFRDKAALKEHSRPSRYSAYATLSYVVCVLAVNHAEPLILTSMTIIVGTDRRQIPSAPL